MKTTIEISDVLFRQAKQEASKKGMTFKQFFESALNSFLKSGDRKGSKKPFKLKKCIIKGEGMAEDLEGNWPAIRALIYEGRGG